MELLNMDENERKYHVNNCLDGGGGGNTTKGEKKENSTTKREKTMPHPPDEEDEDTDGDKTSVKKPNKINANTKTNAKTKTNANTNTNTNTKNDGNDGGTTTHATPTPTKTNEIRPANDKTNHKKTQSREMYIREQSQLLMDRLESERCEKLLIRQSKDDLWKSRLNIVVANGNKRHDWIQTENFGCPTLFKNTDPQLDTQLHHYQSVGSHAELVAQSCQFLLARDEWKALRTSTDEVKTATMNTVENVWSAVVREKQALVNANMEEIGWLNDVDHSNLFGTQNKSSLSTNWNIKTSVFRRWKLWYQNSKSIRLNTSLDNKKRMFLQHCLRVYRLVCMNMMRDAFHLLYKSRPAPFRFKVVTLAPDSNFQRYDKWGEPMLSKRKDRLLVTHDGSIVLNLSTNMIKTKDRAQQRKKNSVQKDIEGESEDYFEAILANKQKRRERLRNREVEERDRRW